MFENSCKHKVGGKKIKPQNECHYCYYLLNADSKALGLFIASVLITTPSPTVPGTSCCTTSTGTYDSRITIIICWYGTVPYQPQLLLVVLVDNTDGGMMVPDTCCCYDGTGTL